MKKSLLKIIRDEFDPRHDFDRFGDFRKLLGSEELRNKSFIKACVDPFYFFANGFIKTLLRYTLPAAGAGALLFYASGKDPGMGAKWYAGMAGGIDACQYGIRGAVIPTIKMVCRDLKKAYVCTKDSLREPSNGTLSN